MKGQKIFSAVDDYVVIDIETCGLNKDERSKIVEISALRYRNDKLTDKFTQLINPKCHIPETATQIHHITDSMVANAPEINEVFDEFLDFIGNDILIGHNIDTYDLNILSEISEDLCGKPILNSYIDTYRLAKMCLTELQNHRLETLVDYLGLSDLQEHRAENDCILTQELYVSLKPLCTAEVISPKFYSPKSKNKAIYNYAWVDKKSVNNNPFIDKTCIVYGAFQQLSTEQINNLFKVLGAVKVDYFCYSADYLILGDEMHKKYTSGIYDDIINSFLSLKKPVLSEYDFVRYGDIAFSENEVNNLCNANYDVNGKTVCLTGNFDIGSREDIINWLTSLGAIVKKGVIKSLDYLIVGNSGSDQYKDETKGTKLKKAEEFNGKGANIQIIYEKDFIKEAETV